MNVRVGVVQIGAIPFDVGATISKTELWIAKAGLSGCQVVVFPEALVAGYPKGSDFDISVGRRTDRGRAEFARYFEASITVPGPETGRAAPVR